MTRAAPCLFILLLALAPRSGAAQNTSALESARASAIQITFWETGAPPGAVYGFALGLPTVRARRIHGLAAGLLGVDVQQSMRGAAFGGLGVGTEEDLLGLTVSGFGIGAERRIAGVALAGFGVGARTITGLTVAGFGIGAERDLNGLAVAGAALGAHALNGLAVAGLAAGLTHVRGLTYATGYFHVPPEGRLTGFSVSLFNHIEGQQRGLTLGLFNYARRLHGVQIGLLNYAGNNRFPFRLLPAINLHLP